MRILKIYIENFGCLHQYTKEFDQNLTIIEEDNGRVSVDSKKNKGTLVEIRLKKE